VFVKENVVVKRPTTKLTVLVILAAVSAVSVQGSHADEGIVAAGAEIATLADGFKFTEGPACDAEGNVFFTDQPNDRIMKWSVDGQLSTFMKPCGRSNGLYFDGDGKLWACADEKNELWVIAPDGSEHDVVLKDFEGKLLNGPNDLWIRPDGGIYFSDPFYKRPYWNRGPREQDVQGVYYLTPDRKQVKRVANDLQQPNGLIGTPDGKTLYVADIRAKKTYAYDVQDDGNLANKRLFCEMGSDGMTIDQEGNVYVTGNGVTVFNAAGRQIDQISIPGKWTANVCFGGADRQTLFITSSDSLYGIRTRVKGVSGQ
jgi:gluconolactonase